MKRFFNYYIKRPVRNFFTGVRNIFRWLPTIYNDRDWDYSFLLNIERKKLANMVKWYEDNDMGHCVNGEFVHRDMKLAVALLDIILGNDEWWTVEITDVPMIVNGRFVGHSDDDYILDKYVNLKNWKRYLPKMNEHYFKRNPKLYSIDLREMKAWNLYHKLREERMKDWWD